MEQGSSESWQEAMKIMTGGETSQLDGKPILEYFDPLIQWLKEQIKDNYVGWNSSDYLICPEIDDM